MNHKLKLRQATEKEAKKVGLTFSDIIHPNNYNKQLSNQVLRTMHRKSIMYSISFFAKYWGVKENRIVINYSRKMAA